MPFSFIPAALGVAFFLIWAFIGAMLLRNGHLAAQQEQQRDQPIMPLGGRSPRRGAA